VCNDIRFSNVFFNPARPIFRAGLQLAPETPDCKRGILLRRRTDIRLGQSEFQTKQALSAGSEVALSFVLENDIFAV
jgi:hypothetical protein